MTQLGHLEAAVMDRLWAWNRPVAVKDVVADFRRDREIAYTTVMTVLDNLHKKRMVTREKSGRAFLYEPARSQEDHAVVIMEQVLAATDNRAGALLRFVEHLSEDEVEELRAALAASSEATVPPSDDATPAGPRA